MAILLGQTAPDFSQVSSKGKIEFHSWLGSSWGILFSHPSDFTPVCTTELAQAARLMPEWEKRNVKIIALSVDTGDNHFGWEKDIEETQGQSLNFPVLADHDMLVTKLYGMVHPECDPEITVRTVFIIDPDKKVRLMMMYPPSAGRNFYEILRAVDSLQTSDKYNVATPVDWRPGEPAIIPQGITDEAAKKLFPQGWKELTPYLRIVELPRE